VKEIVTRREVLFVQETDTIVRILDELASNKTTFAVVMSKGKPIGTVDVIDLFKSINRKISYQQIPFEELIGKLETLKTELANATLNEIVPYSNDMKLNWSCRTIPADKSVLQLIAVFQQYPSLHRVPILDEKGEVISICELADVLRFILDNHRACSSLINRHIGDLNFKRQSIAGMRAYQEDMMNAAFKLLWDKHINGLLASCNRSSTLDLFFNYVHYVVSGFQVFPEDLESEPVGQTLVTSTMEDVIELMLRENLDSVYIIDKQPKRIIGLLTIQDVLTALST